MIVFKKLKWKNFLSTGNTFTEFDLNKAKTNLIVGTNGAGKSTILDALTFSLFGKPFRKINKPMLLNSINGSDLVTEIEFESGRNQFKIIRGINQDELQIIYSDCGSWFFYICSFHEIAVGITKGNYRRHS